MSKKYGEHEMLVSRDKYDFVVDGGPKWCVQWNPTAKTFYARRSVTKANGKQTGQIAHRYITNCPPNLVVDHINHNGLDNRNENLRIVTVTQNNQNARHMCRGTNSTSQYRGVNWNTSVKNWRASITVNGQLIQL
jgi:hypothetical protein